MSRASTTSSLTISDIWRGSQCSSAGRLVHRARCPWTSVEHACGSRSCPGHPCFAERGPNGETSTSEQPVRTCRMHR
ncbi:hypothetical protein PsYK624_110120 [Phanerochaete sordida]|uniref:Uncharacterized protein n=1 Tax=Phanerochaete sordida TaxID=48140 RepID=A0A9P3GFR3_9APHY|nr:hypothetical protein PsYK624_110120 [Phanerochaete sordida]